MRLLVGLGNPGQKYEKTRHNAGFLVLDRLLERVQGSWSGSKFDAEWGRCRLLGEDCLVVKPQTFMNLSGRSVASFVRFFKLLPTDVVVLHDDIDVPFGKVKARTGGGHGGHNGIRSLLDELGDENFGRIKLGVGRPESKHPPVVDWVLGDFSESDLTVVQGEMVEETWLRLKGLFSQKA